MPNDHDRYEELIPDYLSGRLSGSDAEEVLRHAKSCERCSRTLAELRPVFSQLIEDKEREDPSGYFSTVLPNVRSRIEAARGVPGRGWIPEVALPAAGLALAVMVLLTLSFPHHEDAFAPEALSQALGDVPADVLADALAAQADRAGMVDGSLLDVISNERLDLEIVKTFVGDPSTLGDLEGSSEALWPTDLSEGEVTVLLQRLSEREVL